MRKEVKEVIEIQREIADSDVEVYSLTDCAVLTLAVVVLKLFYKNKGR